MSSGASIADAVPPAGVPPRHKPTLRSWALASTAVAVAASAVVFFVVDVWFGTSVIALPVAWALSELHGALHTGMFGSLADEHPVISKTTYFVGSAALLASSVLHLRHEWAHHVKDAYAKGGLRAVLPTLKKEFGGHVALCLTKAGKIVSKAAHYYFDGAHRHVGPTIIGVP